MPSLSLLLSLWLPSCVSVEDRHELDELAEASEPAVASQPVRQPPVRPVVALAEAPPESPRLGTSPGRQALARRLVGHLDLLPSEVALVVDRPLYRPGETVWARAFELQAGGLLPEVLSAYLRFQLEDPRGNVVLEHLRPRGAEWASFELPAHIPGGQYTLSVAIGSEVASRPIVVRGYEAPKIRKELDLLREAYGPGDEVTASLSLASAGAGPLADHPVEILVQVGGRALPRIEARTDLDGEALLRFELPADLDRSDVLMTVLVEEGGWSESISRPVPVVLDTVAIEWFPEGGDLVAGLPGRVYLRARDAHGEPADVAGVVIDGLGREVADFRTVHDGLGRFELNPQLGHGYTAQLTEPASMVGRRLELPAVQRDGCVLRSYDDLDGQLPALRVGVWCSTEREVSVSGVHQEQLLEVVGLRAGPDAPALAYLRSDDPVLERRQGVTRVTLHDEAMEPVAERLVYRNRSRSLQIEIDPDRPGYGPRDEVVLSITTRDPQGEPVAADLALSVVDDRVLKLADDEHGHLLTQLYLDPWTRGVLPDPAWYLDPEEEDGALGLDLVMGTYGWRRFLPVPPQAGEGTKARKEEGKVGKKEAKTELARGSKVALDPQQQRQLERRIAENAGVLGALRDAGELDGVFGPGADLTGGIGGLIGAHGEAVGAGGLGARGSGLGGGGTAEGLGGLGVSGWGGTGGQDAGLGGLGTRGIGSGRSGFGSGGGTFGAKGLGGLTQVGGNPIILGAMDRSLIDEVIKRHMNSIKYCYQRELTRNPALGGKLVIKFTIASDGTVAAAAPKSSTMGNASVEQCVVGRFMRMRFPSPRGGGITIVSYPLRFASDGAVWGGRATHVTPAREFPRPDYRNQPPPSVRSDFRDTVMWAPRVQTGDDGTAEVRFPVSDAITTFTVTAQGIGGGHAGRVEHTLDVSLPFALDVPVPEAVSAGDRLLLPARVRSRRDEALDVALTTSVGAPLSIEDGTGSQQLRLAPDEAITTLIPIVVPQGAGTAQIEVAASGLALSDAVQREVQISPRGFPVAWSASGQLGEVSRHTVDLSGATEGSTSGRLTVYPSALTTLLDGLQDMVRMPGGCFEQTSSSNYPNVLVLDLLDRTGRSPRLRVDRGQALQTGYQRLVGYQIEAGGFETFGRGPGKEVLSAYGLLQFSDMARVWPGVDPAMLQRDVDFLYSARDGEGGFSSSGASAHAYGGAPGPLNDVFITWAMVEAGHRDLSPELARTARLARQTSDPYLLALATLTLQHTDPAAGAAALRRLLALQADDGSFPGAQTSVVGSRGTNLTVETTALATLALIRSPGHGAQVPLAARWLAQARSGHGWGSTQASVLALRALSAASGHLAEHDPSGEVVVRVDGIELGRMSWTGHEQQAPTLELGDWLSASTHEITVEHRGTELPFTLEVGFSSDVPPDHPLAPLSLHTELASGAVQLAEPVRMTATVQDTTGEGVVSPLARIGLPAGVRVETWQLQQLQDRGEIAFFEIRPREVTLYWEGFVAHEARTVALDLIPEVPGRFTAPASSAFPYYDAQRAVWDEGVALIVRP